jgi:hypothetical protein
VRAGIVVVLAVALLLAVSGRLTLPFGPHRPSPLPGYGDQYDAAQSSPVYASHTPANRLDVPRPSTVAQDLRQSIVRAIARGYPAERPKDVSCRRSHTLDGPDERFQSFTASYNCTLTWSGGIVRKWCAYSIYAKPFARATPKTCEADARDPGYGAVDWPRDLPR